MLLDSGLVQAGCCEQGDVLVAPVILSVVAFIAGHPTQVACDNTLAGHQNGAAAAWTPYGGNVIYATDLICADAAKPIGSYEFALALSRFIHEAAHARGIRVEACAEMLADIGIYQVLRDFYGVPFFSPTSEQVGAQVLTDVSRRLPPEYQPEGCWSLDVPR